MSDLNSLATGQYYIRNDEAFAGRNRIEDKSLNPKRVACPTDHDDPELWIIERLSNGRFVFRARGAPTGVKNGLLFAFLIETERPEEWIVTFRKVDDKHRSQYTIEKADRSGGWVRQGGEDAQIAVRRLIVGPSDPPFFPPSQLWNIQPLVD